MAEFLEEKFEDIFMLSLIFASFLSLTLCSTYIPPPYGQMVGTFLYLAIILGGVIFSDVYARYVSSQYPYLQIIVRPSNKTIHAFVDKDQTLDRKIAENTYTLHLRLASPVRYEDYGRVKELIIHHKGKLADKLYFRPGWCVWKGIRTRHPQTEIIEVLQVEKATTSIDHGEPIPVFYLVHGSKDVSTYQAPVIAGNPASIDVNEYMRRISALEAELAKVRRDAVEWQQRALAAEEIIGQQRAETAGLLEAKTGIKEHALELMLGFRLACASFDRAIESLRGGRVRFTFTKWVALTIIAVAFIVYLWANPNVAQEIALWLRSPINSIIVLAAVVVIIAVLFARGRRK